MRIALNCALAGPSATGIGVYAGALAAALPSADDGRHAYDVYVGEADGGPGDAPASGRARYHVVPPSGPVGRLRWDTWRIGRAARRARADLLHSTTAYLPLFPPCPCVLTVHDLAIYRYPDAFRIANRTLGRRLFEASVRRAAALIAVSEATRRDVMELLGVAPEKVTVVQEAADPLFSVPLAADDLERVRAAHGLHRPYVLSVATAEPRKNLSRLLDAFCACRPLLDPDVQLVLVGKRGWLAGPLEAKVRQLEASGVVKATGFVPRADLPGLYAGAAAFAYPSLYEGFGLPVLEALACGAPTLTSSCSSLPEVAGDAAVLVDPTSTDEIAAGLWRLLRDAALADDLRRRCPARAARFTWRATARRTIEVYERAVSLGTRPRPAPPSGAGRTEWRVTDARC